MEKFDSDINNPASLIDNIVEQSTDDCEYYLLEELGHHDYKGYSLCAIHINIHSLVAKLDDLKHIISTLHERKIVVHFILICETFLNDNSIQLCTIEGYKFVCNNRSNGKRGGVAIYVLDSLSFKLRDDLTLNFDNQFETIFIEVKHGNSNILVGEIYRTPNSPMKQSVERFQNIINELNGYRYDVILGTDQNFDLIKYNNDNYTKDLLDSFINSGYLPAITKPTRITHSSATLIDNLYLKGFSYTYQSCILNYDISDHLPILVHVGKRNLKSKPEPIHFEYRQWTDNAIASIKQELSSKDWSSMESINIDGAYDLLIQNVQSSIDAHAPLKTACIPPKHIKWQPWMTKG